MQLSVTRLEAPIVAIGIFREQLTARAEEYRQKSKAQNTRDAYASDWRQWSAWCAFSGAETLPGRPEAIVEYLTALTVSKTPHGRDYSPATIGRRLASIAHFHRAAGLPDPTKDQRVVSVMEGIRRDMAARPSGQKAALLTKHLRKALRGDRKKPADYRDRALLLIGFAGAFRRSELVGVDVEHLLFDDEGRVRITLPKSKTNQLGELETVWILPGGEYCPVRALREWLEISGVTTGAVFCAIDRHKNVKGRLSTDSVGYICKRAAKRAGLNPDHFAAHSLRSGHVTQSLLNDVPLPTIQQQTRHRDINTLIAYNRHIEPMKNNSSASLGL